MREGGGHCCLVVNCADSFVTPGDLPSPGIEPASLLSPALAASSLPLSHGGSPVAILNSTGDGSCT